MKYLLGCGFYAAHPDTAHADFKQRIFELWCRDLERVEPAPDKTVVIVNGGVPPKATGPFETLVFKSNLGGWADLLPGEAKPNAMCGWSAAFLSLATLAYLNESDFIFKEQDVVAYGPWVSAMYADCAGKDCVFGSDAQRGAANSLVLIRHEFIPWVVQTYIALGPERDRHHLSEWKFTEMERRAPEHFGRLSFGFDTTRPIRYHDPVWYAHVLSEPDLRNFSMSML